MGNTDSAQLGYHVLQVSPNSPGEQAGLTPFFDFILSANGTPLDKEDNRFATILQTNLGKAIELKVYNSKTETIQDAQLTPSDSWGGLGLGGISVRFCDYSKVMENVWHVLEVPEGSPAAQAGLEAHTDYIVGSPEVVFNSENDFHNLLKTHLDKPLQLYIYSSLTDSVRLVTLVPSENWGGNGVLGCDVGYGLIHRIPTRAELQDHASSANQHITHIESQLQNLAIQPPIVGSEIGSDGQIKDSAFQEIPLEELQELPQYYKQQVFQGQENSLQQQLLGIVNISENMEAELLLSDLPTEVLFCICYNLSRTSLVHATRVNKSLRGVCQYLLEHKRKIRLVDDNLNALFCGLGPLSGVTSCMKNLYRMGLTPPEEPVQLLPKYKRKLIIKSSSLSMRNKPQTIAIFEGHHEYLMRAAQADICVLVYGAYDKVEENVNVNKIIAICHMMSSRDIIIAINLDSTSKTAEKVFFERRNFLSEILNKAIGPCFEIIPVDAIRGTNLTRTSEKFDWFKGGSLFSLLRASQHETNYDENLVEKLRKDKLQINLYDCLRPEGSTFVYLGRIMSGSVRIGDKVFLRHYGHSSTVTRIEINKEKTDLAVAGDCVGIQLKEDGDWRFVRKFNPIKEMIIKDTFNGNLKDLEYTIAFRAKFVVLDGSYLNQMRSYKTYYGGLRYQCRLLWIFPQKKFQTKKDAKNLKVFSAIMWPYSRLLMQPFKATEFQKNYDGKVLLAENHVPIAVGRIDKVLNFKHSQEKPSSRHYFPKTEHYEALFDEAKTHLFNPDEGYYAEQFVNQIKHPKNSTPYSTLIWSM